MLSNFKYIEQYFNSNPNFECTSSCTICRNGNGTDMIFIKIVLPNLPNQISYKLDITYDLIKEINIQIGGKKYFQLIQNY